MESRYYTSLGTTTNIHSKMQIVYIILKLRYCPLLNVLQVKCLVCLSVCLVGGYINLFHSLCTHFMQTRTDLLIA